VNAEAMTRVGLQRHKKKICAVTRTFVQAVIKISAFCRNPSFFPYAHDLSSSTWFEYKFLDYTSVRPILMYVIHLHLWHSSSAFLRSLLIVFSYTFHFFPVGSILQPQSLRPLNLSHYRYLVTVHLIQIYKVIPIKQICYKAKKII
jgi:hypothetical protein